jgi:hypothetical protein
LAAQFSTNQKVRAVNKGCCAFRWRGCSPASSKLKEKEQFASEALADDGLFNSRCPAASLSSSHLKPHTRRRKESERRNAEGFQ